MRQRLLAYGYKPSELCEIGARDVVDFFRGFLDRAKEEHEIWLDRLEFAGIIAKGGRRTGKVPERMSEGARAIKEQYDEIDRKKGIKVT